MLCLLNHKAKAMLLHCVLHKALCLYYYYFIYSCHISTISTFKSLHWWIKGMQQDEEKYLCEEEKLFCRRQQERLIATDSYSTLWGVIWNKAAGSSLLWDTSFTSRWHESTGVGWGVGCDRWTGKGKEIQRGDGNSCEKERDEELKGWRGGEACLSGADVLGGLSEEVSAVSADRGRLSEQARERETKRVKASTLPPRKLKARQSAW